jgi:hypothetical protein
MHRFWPFLTFRDDVSDAIEDNNVLDPNCAEKKKDESELPHLMWSHE